MSIPILLYALVELRQKILFKRISRLPKIEALPDGQLLASYIVEQGDDYNIYTSPIMLNEVETNLRIRLDYQNEQDYTITIIGTWDGIDEVSGSQQKPLPNLKRVIY